MKTPAFTSLASILLLLAGTDAAAQGCPAVATARPEPPASQGLYPVRVVRADGRAVDPTSRQEMFRATRANDGPIATSIDAAPPSDAATMPRSEVQLSSGPHALQVVEQIPDDALTAVALKDRRRAALRSKPLTLDAVDGREYAIAARLIPEQKNRVRTNAHWEPVVWREQARDCR